MQLLLILVLPFLGALFTPLVGRAAGRVGCGLAALAVPAASLILLLRSAPSVLSGDVIVMSWSWIPGFGLDCALRLDGLSFLFALLVLAIGLLVLIYSYAYLGEREPLGRFLGLMLGFMGGMLGIVLAENLLLMVLFWEITSLSSFLLIGFHHREAEARRAALMALTITGAGGLALLGGILLLAAAADSFALTEVLDAHARIAADPLRVPMLLLIVLAAFTKSAQLPLHFWLPNAMVAPTPVSAYLHSAAMVKAGVYLLARLWPGLSGLELWTPLVGAFGLATMIAAAYFALRQADIKALLAYSTISHLGMMVMLLGLGTPYAAVVALFHILNHALFKAALFMIGGAVEHVTGTRDLERLGGLWRAMPATSAAALLATAAMAGVPPLNGYISKEMMLDAAVEVSLHGAAAPLLPALVTLGALLSAGYAFAFAWRAFLASGPATPHEPHEPHLMLSLPAYALAAACLAIGLLPGTLAGPLVDAAVGAVVTGAPLDYELALWHGLNLPFLLGLGALAGGIVVAELRRPLAAAPTRLPRAEHAFDRLYNALVVGTGAIFRRLHDCSLQRYLAILLAAIVLAGFLASPGTAAGGALQPVTWLALVGWAILVTAAVGTVWMHEHRLVAIVLISVVGLLVVLAYAHLSAPDLALTQIAVEIVTTVLLLLAIRLLPPPEARARPGLVRRLRDGALALGAGTGAGVLAFVAMTRPRDAIVAREVLAEATEIHGRNLVHLVLVDFRAFDTLGEISVLMIAALGVFALIRGFLHWLGDQRPPRQMIHPESVRDPHPLQLVIAARLLLPLALLVAVFLFLRGAAHPGGGFVAGLVVAMAVLIQYMAHGVAWTERRILIGYRNSVALGVLVAVLTGLGSAVRGDPFMTQESATMHWPVIGELELSTSLLFDFGVFLTVAGATLLAMVNLGRIETRAPQAG